MKRFNKAATDSSGGQPTTAGDHRNDVVAGVLGANAVSVVLRDPPLDVLWTVVGARNLDHRVRKAILPEDDLAQPVQMPKDKILGDILPTGFDEESCLSRYQSLLYRRGVPRKASPHLISKLRSYEALHKKCGPYTALYNKTMEDLKSGRYSSISDYLFCEPFPDVSWLLPLDFPLTNKFNGFNWKSPESYGNLLKSNSLGNLSGSAPQPYVYLHLVHDYDDHDKLFFCDQDQSYLQKIPWLIMKTDNYFIPSLFLIHSFEQELHNLFPDKETVFHLLGRYLFHPTNSVWGLISRYYEAYLSKADVKVGIQIRVFDTETGPFKHVLDQILSCTMKEGILPQINEQEPIINPSGKQKTVSVLMTSLSGGYFEELRDLYWEHPTVTGDVIEVYQPSHEGHQQTEKQNHNRKAWAEMYLLSLTDKLVTSSWSTFGYVAQGLGNLKPWILYKPENRTAPDPPCRRAVSMEPCFHAPPFYDCKLRRGVDTGALVPHVKHCEDMSWGLKLVEPM
ncbi:UNVERIFIED_CONTAM: Galactoside 2-alpha-L-fucosyltransferase [Sesamum latifolium]|uniref:Fucosyltransferase n=1 Tax=Sesamum latifolium TaxID=2727402 RepID=A0AAW2UI61_9LAMI